MRVGGRAVTSDEWIPVLNPADSREVVGRVPLGNAGHVAAATAAAAAAFPAWSGTPPAERAARLREAGQALLADTEARAVLLARECGALLSEARGGVLGCTRALDYYAKVGESFAYEEELPSPNGRVIVAREPMGVAVVIVPWNSPTYLGYLALGPDPHGRQHGGREATDRRAPGADGQPPGDRAVLPARAPSTS